VSVRRFLILSLTLVAVAARAASVPVVVTGAPSPLGLPFSSFANVSLMAQGRIAFLGSSTGAFRRGDSGLERIVAAGDVLADGTVVAGVSAPALGPGDCVALRAFLVGGGGRILRRCQGTTDTVVATGDAAPDGRSYTEFVAGVAYGAQGQIAFSAILDDGSTGVFLDVNGARTTIARTGGSPAEGPVYSALRLIGVTADGRVGVRASVEGGRDGLFLSTGDRLRRVVEVGEATPVGGTFRSVAGASMNDGGTFAFRGDLSDGTGGVFRVDTSDALPRVQVVVREGDSVAGARVRMLASSLTPSINAAGDVAYRASLEEADSGSAIFVTGRDGVTTRVVGASDQTVVGDLVRLRDAALADDGSIVLPASVRSGGPSLFVVHGHGVSPLARLGERTDIDTGLERFRFSQPNVRGSAEAAVFLGSRDGIFLASAGGAIETVAFVGGPTPLGGTFAGFDPPAADGTSAVAFGAEIRGSGRASRAIITRKGTSLRSLAESSERVHGGRLVDFFAATLDPLTRPDVGPRGEIAFEATMNFGRIPRAILLGRGGRPQPVVRARKRAPGGGQFDSFGTPAVMRGRRMAFVAQVSDGGTKVFLLENGRTRILAAEGRGAPGRVGGRFTSFDPPDANEKLIAFHATLDQGREGVFLASRQGPELLVGTGDPAPGGARFRGFQAASLGGTSATFLGRLIGVPGALGLYRVPAAAVPDPDAAAPTVQAVGVPGQPSPLGGTIAEFGSFDLNGDDRLAVVVDLAGGSTRSALFLVDPGSAIVP